MKVAIYGAGAMGTVLGAFLARGGEKIDLVTRNEAHVREINKHGARIVGTVNMTKRLKAMLPSDMKEKYDIIFLMTKQLKNKEVVSYLIDFLHDDGIICSMQNGIPEMAISKIIGEERTYGCTMNWAASTIRSGVVKLTSENTPETLSFGLGSFHNKNTPHLKEIKRLLSIMGEVRVENNFIGVRWSKLLINSGFNGLSAILGATLGEITQNKTSRQIFQSLLKECIDVAEKNHIKIAKIQGINIVKLLNYNNIIKKWVSFTVIPILLKKHQHSKSSTYQDIKNGAPTEIEAINGLIISYGEKVRLDTPFNRRVIRLVRDLEAKKINQGLENIGFFKDLL